MSLPLPLPNRQKLKYTLLFLQQNNKSDFKISTKDRYMAIHFQNRLIYGSGSGLNISSILIILQLYNTCVKVKVHQKRPMINFSSFISTENLSNGQKIDGFIDAICLTYLISCYLRQGLYSWNLRNKKDIFVSVNTSILPFQQRSCSIIQNVRLKCFGRSVIFWDPI